MRNKFVTGIICIIILLVVMTPTSAGTSLKHVAIYKPIRNYWGVIIGITDYKGETNDIPCPNEVIELYKILLKQKNWNRKNLKLLVNESATKGNILASLDWLSDVSGPDDIVIFYFSGHGSETKDLNGDEKDGMDEAIVAWEGLDGLITDDELDRKFDKIKARGMGLFFDCCLSGGLLGDAIENVHKKTLGMDKGFFNVFHRAIAFKKEFSNDLAGKNRVILASSRGLTVGIKNFPPIFTDGVVYAIRADWKDTVEGVYETVKYTYRVYLLVPILLAFPGFLLKQIQWYLETGHIATPYPVIYDNYPGELKFVIR